VYLSFDLSKAEERACYKFLIESDRAKKKIICIFLIKAGLVTPKMLIADEELMGRQLMKQKRIILIQCSQKNS
jgi:hypothetical protein